MELEGRVAVVTGAGAGLGRGIAERLAGEGATVLVADRDPEAAGSTVEALRSAGGRAASCRVDLALETGVRELLRFCKRELGALDLLVNNAGGVDEPCFPDAPPERWSRILDLNLRSPMLATQLALEAMRPSGGGAIVNVASMAGLGFGPHAAPEYAAAKAGLARFTAAVAPAAMEAGVRVSAVCPGWVDTPASRATRAAMSDEERRSSLPRHVRSPEEVADLVLRLLRDELLAGRVVAWPDDEPWRPLEAGPPS